MNGEDPSDFQGQYKPQHRRQQQGGQQFERGQRQQPGARRMQGPQGQQFPAGGTGTQQPPTQQPPTQQRRTQQYQSQQRRTQQHPTQQRQRHTQQAPIQQGQRGGQFGQSGQQRMQGQQAQRQQGMAQQGTQPRQRPGTARTRAGVSGQQVGRAPSTRGYEMQSVTLEEVSRSEVVTVEPDETIANVAVEMADKDVGSVVVIEDGEPLGVLTDRKLALSLGEKPDVADRTAGELVSGDLVTGTPGMTVYDAVREMRDAGIRRLPILDGEGKLDGIVSLDDIIVLIAGELGAAAEVIEQQAPPR